MNQSVSNLKLAERGAIISILTYLFLSAAKLATGHLLHSSSLVADGFNNVSDIVGKRCPSNRDSFGSPTGRQGPSLRSLENRGLGKSHHFHHHVLRWL